ncbi:MAG: phosphatidate cytidylyltransferase [Bdellovibrionales bacterium]
MADSRSTLVKRVISAALGALIVLGVGYFGGRPGLYIVCTAAIVLGIREYSRIAFLSYRMPSTVTHLYWLTSILFYGLLMRYPDFGLMCFALSNVVFFSGTLWLCRDRVSNENLLPALALGTFGMLYCVLFPLFAIKTIQLDSGSEWFLFLLLVVFSGDTFAYFAGRCYGGRFFRRKLMPQVSPNKTWEGAFGGLLGSAVMGTVYVAYVFPGVPLAQTAAFSLVCAFAAQSGDLLISLVKRVAHVKDSGGIMPGHGGILDRLDGVFIACPLVFAFAIYVGAF